LEQSSRGRTFIFEILEFPSNTMSDKLRVESMPKPADLFSHFNTILACDRQDRQTYGHRTGP